jgi:hypothetical protein
MEEEMSVATDVPRRQLVFIYSYGFGGWGDLLKGLHTCWCWAAQTNRELRIDFSRHVFGKLFPQYAVDMVSRCNQTLNLLDKVGQVGVSDIAGLESIETLGVVCNWFSPSSVEGVPGEVVLRYFEKVYTEIFPIRPLGGAGAGAGAGASYNVFHCRMGDKYLSEAYACKGDNRIGSMGDMAAKLALYKEGIGTERGRRTLVCSDHEGMIRSLLQQIPNSFCICKEPYHIAYYTRDIDTRVGNIREMIEEHSAMSRGRHVFMVAYSGFPITAAMIGNVPLSLGGEEYHDEYVDFIRRLRAV